MATRNKALVSVAGFLVVAVVLACLVSACTAVTSKEAADTAPVSFADYQREVLTLLRDQRAFQTRDPDAELAWNAPQEWRPDGLAAGARAERGILLVHGLSDSPWSFVDLASKLVAQGVLVRTVLLPGHGTQPDDLLEVELAQWRQVVQAQADALLRDADQVYLGGFSTGANLVLEVAYAQPDIAGLVLFSPGFRASSRLSWLAPLAAPLRPWIVPPGEGVPVQNAVRYLNTPTNGFAQFHHSSRAAQRLLRQQPYHQPVFMAVAQQDSVLDTDYLLDVFQRRFTHPASRLVWYGGHPVGLNDDGRVLVRRDHLPAQRISQFSHMGLPFSPTNPLYGEQGRLRLCWNGQDEQAMQACEQGEPVWYSDWGYRAEGKIHARLTFNPYFDWQASVITAVLDSGGRRPSRP